MNKFEVDSFKRMPDLHYSLTVGILLTVVFWD